MKALDAGYKFTNDEGVTFPYRGQGITISTLGEVLQAIPDHRFMIEIKGGENAAQLTVDAIRAVGATNRVLLASISPLYMHNVRNIAPEIATCYDYVNALKMLTILRKGDWESYEPTDLMLAAEPTLIKQLSIVPSEIQAIREKGILYQVFTLNTQQEMREHIAIGLDSILTDRPDLLAEILDIK
jgi:glycerophosphoryl diester phosphodiesterase